MTTKTILSAIAGLIAATTLTAAAQANGHNGRGHDRGTHNSHDWNRGTHRKSGLWDKVLASEVSLAQAEAVTVDFLAQWVPAGKSPICGNSICQDRRFLVRLMPRLERYFHYRNLDVSTLKELSQRWSPDLVNGFAKAGSHTAMADIRESVNELAYYRQFMGKLGGQAS